MKNKMIKDTNLSVKVKNCLINFGRIYTVEQLLNIDEKSLLKIRGIGDKSLKEINAFLTENK